MTTNIIHEENMRRAAGLSAATLGQVCAAMSVAAPDDEGVDGCLDALSDSSWDGAHGTEEEFDRRLKGVLDSL